MRVNKKNACVRWLMIYFTDLGSSPVMHVGAGSVRHDAGNHVLKVHDGEKLVSVIYLV